MTSRLAAVDEVSGRVSRAGTTLQIEAAHVGRDALLCLEGWVAGPRAVEKLQIFLGHSFLGLAELGLPRADVGLVFPGDARAAWSGFRFVADVSGDDVSARTVHARALLADGGDLRASAPLEAAPMSHAPAIPSAELHAACERCLRLPDGTFAISGWACCFPGVIGVTLALDDGPEVAADIGISRPDIGNRFPRIPSARQAGFAFRGRLAGPLGVPRVVEIRLRSADGRRRVLAHPLDADAPDSSPGVGRDLANRIKCFVDHPVPVRQTVRLSAQSPLSLQGWAIARDGVESVEVLLDGRSLGWALHGLHRPETGLAFAEWPDAKRSGFAFTVGPAALAAGRHTLRVVARDRAGHEAETGFRLDVVRDARPLAATQLRTRMTQAEIGLNAAILAARGVQPCFCVVLPLRDAGPAEMQRARATLRTLAEQAYDDWTATVLLPAAVSLDRAALLAETGEIGPRVTVRAVRGHRADGDARATHIMVLRAGDRLGCDALWEFALAFAASPRPGFVYADERRLDRFAGKIAPDFRPQWSPDLLLSTNYIGRSWCADVALVAEARIEDTDMLARGSYDLVLRLTERAATIRHIPKIVCETIGPGATDAQDRATLRRALARRHIAGTVEAGLGPGLHVVRRAATPPLVSIVMPTCGSRGLVRSAVTSIRANAGRTPVELVVVDNISAKRSDTKEWLAAQADIVVDAPGPFNWSRFNNLGAAAASGRILLFLNDDVEARDPAWLDALTEQAQRPEVGVVGARLLYPDGKIQHAGIHLSGSTGLHTFRFMPSSYAGPFGVARTLRDVTAVTGACLMVRRDVFDGLGGFNEAHAIVNNDVDFCLRARAAGLRVVCTPHAELIHHELSSRADLGEKHDAPQFQTAWRAVFARGDAFRNPNLSRASEHSVADPEPTCVVVAGHPLMAADQVRRVLVLKLDHVGDFVTAIPALRRLKLRFPGSRVDVVCHPVAAPLARAEPSIDRVIELSIFHPASSRGRRRVPAAELDMLAATLGKERYDLAIDLRKHPESRGLLRRTGARVLAGFDRNKEFAWLDVGLDWDGDPPYVRKRNHVADDLLALVEAVAIACEPRAMSGNVAWQAQGKIAAGVLPERTGRLRVCVHPAAGSALKQWAPEHFAALMDLLADDEDAEFVLIGGAADQPIAARVLARMAHADRVLSLVGKIGLEALPGVLRDCDLFVGNDSGPKHLAGFLGVPTIGIHSGVVDPTEWGPLGERSVAVHRQMLCSPCYLTKIKACGRGLSCLRQLMPADVAAACRRLAGLGHARAMRAAA